MKKDSLGIFLTRLKNIGISLELFGNYPWMYINTINGKKVKEKYNSDYGFVLGYGRDNFKFEDLKEIFKLLRKYK